MVQPDSNSLDVAAVAFPIIALTASFAINSVDDDDETLYRGVVGGVGLMALIPAAIAALLAIYSGATQAQIPETPIYLFVSVFATIVLTSVVLIRESVRGQENEKAFGTLLIIVISIIIITGIFAALGI